MLGIGLGSGLHPGEGDNNEQENSTEDVPLCYCPQVIGTDSVGLSASRFDCFEPYTWLAVIEKLNASFLKGSLNGKDLIGSAGNF